MSDKTVQQRVNDIVVELMGTPLELLKPEARLDEDLGLDSLDCVETLQLRAVTGHPSRVIRHWLCNSSPSAKSTRAPSESRSTASRASGSRPA